MKGIKAHRGWRAEQIAKLFLLKENNLNIFEGTSSQDAQYDFMVTLKDNDKVQFGIEVKSTKKPLATLKKQIEKLEEEEKINRKIPSLIMLIDTKTERGKMDFLMRPNGDKDVHINKEYQLKPIDKVSFKDFKAEIVDWYRAFN